MKRIYNVFLATALSLLIAGCASQRKIRNLQSGTVRPSLSLTKEQDFIPDIRKDLKAQRDTFVVKDGDKEILIMKAIKNEDGEMVAHDVLDAAVVTARFRNVAERNGRVDIEFQVIVPQSMQDSRWQLRFRPRMYIMQDTLDLDPVIITGAEYRKAQLKGYQQYEKFLATIVTNPDEFVNWWLLELFIERNMPDLYAFKTDSTYVSDEEFASVYGVTEKEAIEHYTDDLARKANNKRISRREKMYRKYVKVPIVTEGLRLDTVIQTFNGDFIYRYVQPIKTRPKLRKVDVVLSGDIYESDTKIYDIPMSDPLTFYISSLSAFVDNRERYLTKVIERRVEENTACYIEFASGSFEVDEKMGNNPEEIGRIKDNLISLMQNEKFDLDSIVVTSSASPEGTVKFNERLSQKRSEGISEYFSKWMNHYQDSLERERGFAVDEEGNIVVEKRTQIPMMGRSSGENWLMLDRLVEKDTVMTEDEKKSYISSAEIKDIDQRERSLQNLGCYRHMREKLYPHLRTVRFDFHLHRKGMVKDTVHTTVLDSTYMNGVQAIRDRDYETALTLLRPYNDYNTAIAYLCMDYNASAMQILESLERSAQVNYMLAVLYSRRGDEQKAVECYVRSCSQDPTYIHRGNLDPEISVLIRRYGLNAQPEDEFEYSL
ncbi:MAG: hypothetical protein IKW27_00025 [Bacteroidales bacterium]|nr:hypothetical protein [Bacteroidales bacterium]